MNYGLYTAASGALASLHRMDVLSSNLANSETPGFKPLLASTRQRLAERQEDHLPFLPSEKMLEQLGGGVMLMPSRVSMRPGSPEVTNRPFDLAIDGPGFFVVRDGASSSPDTLRLTRDGRLAVDSTGRLVQATSGLPVLDRTDSPITLDRDSSITIDSFGSIKQNGQEVATIQISSIPSTAHLRPRGNNLYSAPFAAMGQRTPTTATVIQGAVEGSAVDPVKTMLDISAAERSVSGASKMMQLFDGMMEKAINQLGRVQG